MRLLRMSVQGVALFADSTLTLDFFAVDRVPRGGDAPLADVTRVGDTGSVFSQNVIGVTGVNASGKTTMLKLVTFVVDILAGEITTRGILGLDFPYSGRNIPIEISATFWHEGQFYLIESKLITSQASVTFGSRLSLGYVFEDEELWQLRAKRPNRLMMADPSVFKSKAEVVRRRHGAEDDPTVLSKSELLMLGDNRSIISSVTGRVRTGSTSPMRELPSMTLPASVVNAFDPSVERLDWDEENKVYILKFSGQRERVVDRNVARALLSRGTIYGTELVLQSIDVLSCGGYLLIDEMEEAINRSLVASVMELFLSPITNPHGAQLIFTTHYPELLDILHRKDCVYLLVRDEDMKTQVVKYSDKVDRIENKKSDVILSDMVHGTMPRYPDVRAMREYVRSRVNG